MANEGEADMNLAWSQVSETVWKLSNNNAEVGKIFNTNVLVYGIPVWRAVSVFEHERIGADVPILKNWLENKVCERLSSQQ